MTLIFYPNRLTSGRSLLCDDRKKCLSLGLFFVRLNKPKLRKSPCNEIVFLDFGLSFFNKRGDFSLSFTNLN